MGGNRIHNDFRLQKECLDLMMKFGWSSSDVSEYKKIPSSTLRNWKAHFQLFGQIPAVTRRLKLKMHRHNVHRKCSPELKDHLQRIIHEFPWLYLDEIQTELANRSGVLVATSTIFKVLTTEFKWTLQVAEAAARERNEVERAAHLHCLHTITRDPAQFIFVDESSRSNNVAMRRRLWQPRGAPEPISRYFTDHNKFTYTLIAACDIDGFISESCELIKSKRGKNDANEEAGTVDSERFVAWVEHKLAPNLGNFYLGEPRSIVVLDNATIHSDDRVLNLITARGALLIYQSAYSPDLDPIEHCFRQYKSFLRRHARMIADDLQAHLQALACVTKHNMVNYYKHIGLIQIVLDENMNEQNKVLELFCLLVLNTAQIIMQNNASVVV